MKAAPVPTALRMTYATVGAKTHYAADGAHKTLCGLALHHVGEVCGRAYVDCRTCERIAVK